MQQQLINRSPDLKKLQQEGYELEIFDGYAIVHHIPYLNSQRSLLLGKLITPLTLNAGSTLKPSDHVIYFMGDHPCDKDGNRIEGISHGAPNQRINGDIVMNLSFSNKPPAGYADYFEKFTRYIEIIIAPAVSMYPEITPKTHIVRSISDPDSPFMYTDTNSCRASLGNINDCFLNQKVGIIGLGGTGSYVLDLVAKTKVKEIHLFDGDSFLQHNAFRSPGAAPFELVGRMLKKVNHFCEVYSEMHKGIIAHPFHLDAENMDLLGGLTFVFVCVDSNVARRTIFSGLIRSGIPFIDVGMGVEVVDGKLFGTLRTTAAMPEAYDHLAVRTGMEEGEDDIYASNIQIADLNALNAALAVVKWKKMISFYQDFTSACHSTFTIDTGKLLYDDIIKA